MATTRRPPNRGELLDRAFISAMRFRWRYRGYESKEKTIASLRRRCPGFAAIQYTNAFQKATDLYNCAVRVVKENELWRDYLQAQHVSRDAIVRLRKCVPGFRVATYH